MSCDNYPSKKDVEDFGINTKVVNEFVTSSSKLTPSTASDGSKKLTMSAIIDSYKGKYMGSYRAGVVYDQYNQYYSYIATDGDVQQWSVSIETPLPHTSSSENPANDPRLVRFGGGISYYNGTRTVNEKLSDYVSVKDFGAVGNGISDDTNAFIAAMESGKPVYITSGTYLVSSLIHDNAVLVGESKDSVVIGLIDGSKSAVLKIDSLLISNLTITDNGRSSITASESISSFLIETKNEFTAMNCIFQTNSCVLNQAADSSASKTSVDECAVSRISDITGLETNGKSSLVISNVAKVNISRCEFGSDVARSIINAVHVSGDSGLSNHAVAMIENNIFYGVRNTDAASEVKAVFLQGYQSKVSDNSFSDVFGRSVDIVGNYDYDTSSSAGVYHNSEVSNNRVVYTVENQSGIGSNNDEAGCIYTRYANVNAFGNHLDFSNLLLTSNTFDAISARHGYRRATIHDNIIINPKACAINADISDLIDIGDAAVFVNNNVILQHTNRSRNAIRVNNVSATKEFSFVSIKDNLIDSSDDFAILIANPSPRSGYYTIKSLTISGNWHENKNKYDTVNFEGYPEYLNAADLEVSVVADNSGQSYLNKIGDIATAINLSQRYRCKLLTVNIDDSVTTEQDLGSIAFYSTLPSEIVINGNDVIAFSVDGTQQYLVNLILSGNKIIINNAKLSSTGETSTTCLLRGAGRGEITLNNCSADNAECFVESAGVDINVNNSTVNNVNKGNSTLRSIVSVNSDRAVNITLKNVTGANNSRLYYAHSPISMLIQGVSVGTIDGIKTYEII